jgi:hypothetical protein
VSGQRTHVDARRAERSKGEQSRAEQSKGEQSRAKESRAKESRGNGVTLLIITRISPCAAASVRSQVRLF